MFEEILTSKEDWFLRPGPSSEVVVSSRVRLARNLEGRKFPHHASSAEQREVVDLVQGAIRALPELAELRFVRLTEISSLDRQFLTEHQVISAEHAASLGERAVAFDAKAGLSFLVNEEDHLRLQAFRPGLDLREGHAALARIEGALGAELPFAVSPDWGYLTACPTNVGGALRAGVLLHLPALVYTRRAPQILQGVAQAGLVVRGLHGETTQVPSAFFQVSNQSSLGKKGGEIVDHVDRVARQLAEVETRTQGAVFQQEGLKLEDRICRSLGTLKNARLLTLQEALDGLSALRLGVVRGILKGLDLQNLNNLLILIQPAHLAKVAGKELTSEAEARERARVLGMTLKGTITA